MKCFLIFFLSGLTLCAQVATEIRIAGYLMPSSLAGVPWLNVTHFAAPPNEGHLGVGVSYRGSDFKVDLYIYQALEKAWADLPIKERLQKEVEAIPIVFETMVKGKQYSGVHFIKRDRETFGGLEFTHQEIHYTDQRAGALISHYYLSHLGDEVLKVRVSRSPDSDPEKVPLIMKQIAESLNSPSPPTPVRSDG